MLLLHDSQTGLK